MTDREVMELAAKAAGIEIYESTDGTIQNRPIWVVKAGGGMGTMPYEAQWNPLLDDGDALRLAVKLRMQIDILERSVYALAMDGTKVCELDRADLAAATRRAIVRAAAEIGRSMK